MANRRRRAPRSNSNNPTPQPREVENTSKEMSNQSKMYEVLKYDASNIYFSNLLGTPLQRRSSAAKGIHLPGILVFDSMLNVNNRSDMVNVAATSIYTFVRHANSGRTNYESSDLMMYLLSMSEIYVGLSELIRAYGIANYFTSENLYSGQILEALGFNPFTFRNNLADIRYRINNLINKVKAFAVPKAFNFFEERISEFMNIYLDEPTPRAQMIAVRPSYLGKFDATAEGGGAIQFVLNNQGNRDAVVQIALIESLIDTARNDEDMNIISGDIMKAYGSNLFDISPITEDFRLEPVYDELFLVQIQNGHFPNQAYPSPITQSGNRISQKIELADPFEMDFYVGDRYLNSPLENVDANLIFAFSKYQIVTEIEEVSGDAFAWLKSANTTFLYRPTLYHFKDNGNFHSTLIQQVESSTTAQLEALVYLSKFKHHMYVYRTDTSLPIGDMHYVAKITPEDTARMNDARFILAFQTQQMG